ncbi:MAG: family 78 glycoside hydrolase catalytic domain [Clostridia bacterium]|nr:family 78 glycoside hydrolase catalytic domain [Clostridia bacterium]
MQKTQWIWLDKKAEPDEYGAFYDEFFIPGTDGAKIKISVAGDYNLYLNGKLIAFGQYADYAHYKVYDEIDISSYLQTGKNELYIVVWYIGESFSTYRDCGVGLWYELVDGKGKIISKSQAGMRSMLANGYVSHQNKIITPQLGFAYTYDTRQSENCWGRAKEVVGFGEKLVKRPNKKLILKDLKRATLIDRKKQLYDLGRETCGFLSMGFKAKLGERIKVVFGEHIVDGEVRANIGIRDFSVELIGNGEYVEFTGAFRRLGCRYLQVCGNAEIEYIGLCETEYPLTVKPFSIENERRQKIYDTAVRTLQLCLHEHYEDCPWREQSMYIMDSRNQMLCGYYAFDNQECAKSAIRLMAEGQKESGLFELCFPADVPITIPSFSLAFVTVVLEYTKQYGDTVFAIQILPYIHKMLNWFLNRLDENGLFKTISEEGIWHFYEWADSLDGAFFSEDESCKERCDYDVLINAFLSIALQQTATLYRLLGDNQKAEKYDLVCESLNAKIKETFFVEKTGLFKTYSRTEEYSELANALCVLAEVSNQEESSGICQKLVDENTDWVKSTLSMAIFRYDALLKVDKEKYAEFVLSDIDKIYEYMLDCGATSFWETIKGESDFDGAGSLCHGWSAIPAYYYHILMK